MLAAMPAAADPPAPTDFVRLRVDEILAIVGGAAEPGTDAFVQRQDNLKAAVRNFIDFEELCRRALGRHWDAQTPEAQAHFVELMTRLIETNYTVKLGDRTVSQEYQVNYDEERIRNETAVVSGQVDYDDEEMLVEIWMLQRDDSWIVYDIVTDDVSLQETYAESFDSIIADEGWDSLVTRLQERVDELEAELEAQRAP
jgi:phospholipid transport system substrate-binding protein